MNKLLTKLKNKVLLKTIAVSVLAILVAAGIVNEDMSAKLNQIVDILLSLF
jgi:hypothetical protein